jgi:3-isopropylmalate dehydrogenase
VIVTDNMFGDIITDLGAMIQGGMGIAAGGNLNPEGVSMFEPIGGSAPKYTNMNVINPLAAISAVQMLLEDIGEDKAADLVDKAVAKATGEKMKSMAAGKMGYSTTEVGDMVAQFVADA